MSVKLNIYNQEAEKTGDIQVSDYIFDVEVNQNLLHQAILTQMGNERQVLAHTKNRSEVRGGGKKPWNQKGTGRARAGTSRSPIWIGGGVTFGPRKDRNFKKNLNKKMKRKALFMILSDKVKNNAIVVLDEIVIKEYKTKKVDKILNKIENDILKNNRRSSLIIEIDKNENLKYSIKNLQGAKIINLENINILDLLKYQNLLITKKAVEKIEEIYKKKSN